MRASNNNRAATVLDLFLQAIQVYGTPSRVRGDRGGENINLAIWMIMFRGPNRASFMWGSYVLPIHFFSRCSDPPYSSTHNTKIERMWVEVGRHFCRLWRGFFTRLERLYRLDRTNPHHLWLLNYLFLDMINADCDNFQREWNHHPLSGLGSDRSPQVC